MSNTSSGNSASSAQYLPNGCPSNFHIHLLLPHETDCSSYYQCSYGMRIQRSCASGTHFDPALQRCDLPENVKCGKPPDPGEPAADPSPEPSAEPSGAAVSFQAVADTRAFRPNGCPVDIHTSYLLPHETNCALYYQCVHGNRVQMPCSPGTLFDYPSQGCVFPFMANCNARPTTPSASTTTQSTTTTRTTTTPSTTTTRTTTTPSTTTTRTTTTPSTTTTRPTTPSTSTTVGQFLPNGCPADFHVHLLLPHETDCAKFYQCAHGVRVEMNCAPGVWFDFNHQGCVFPFMADCNARPSTPSASTTAPLTTTTRTTTLSTTTTRTTTTPSTTTTRPTTPSTSTTAGQFLPNGCPADFHVHHLLPHETDCAKFYQCAHGVRVEMNCAPGTWFDFNLQVCSWPFMVDCVPGSTTTTTTTTSTTPQPTAPPSTEITHPPPTTQTTTEEIQSPETTAATDVNTTPPSTAVPSTSEASTSGSTDESTTSYSTTREPSTTENLTPGPPSTTGYSTTGYPTTGYPTTEEPKTTDYPTTEDSSTTEEPSTEAPSTTGYPTTGYPTTGYPTTEEPKTTAYPTTEFSGLHYIILPEHFFKKNISLVNYIVFEMTATLCYYHLIFSI
ncbi:hypothetical protein O3G_MSEX007223 [Manduca sexta]|uniref:Chitin-binding type-2 domain-containing protein n=1 Tax=Manduca sexta TaxID=7130 RepID=A0A921Z568_MANSE|nr:hypothetical protein O3G_MSEX007223 [Manduca sexta]